jgi:hypothetical protein
MDSHFLENLCSVRLQMILYTGRKSLRRIMFFVQVLLVNVPIS